MSNKRPIIGILANLSIDKNVRFKNYWQSFVNEDYVTSVVKAGGIPYIIPVVCDRDIMIEQIKYVDAIIFSGGDADIDPKFYNEKIIPECHKPNNKRDFFDLCVAKIVQELKKPTLHVCKGHQVLNVSLGGSLYQDLTCIKSGEILDHDSYLEPDSLVHKVSISKDSILYDILQKDEIWVNSFHHQCIKDMPKTLKVVARAEDGVVEAIEYENSEYFCLSLQWHPEMLTARDCGDMLKIFKRLVKEAKINKEKA